MNVFNVNVVNISSSKRPLVIPYVCHIGLARRPSGQTEGNLSHPSGVTTIMYTLPQMAASKLQAEMVHLANDPNANFLAVPALATRAKQIPCALDCAAVQV